LATKRYLTLSDYFGEPEPVGTFKRKNQDRVVPRAARKQTKARRKQAVRSRASR
jgi:hypothetical protein